MDVGNLISGSSALSKSSLDIQKFTVHMLLKPGMENFEHYFASVWNEYNCVVVCAFCIIQKNVGSLISGSSAYSKTRLNIWKFTIHLLLKPGLKNFEYYFARVWDGCNCAVIWAFFGIAFLLDWNENWPFPVLWPLLSFPNVMACWVQHFHSIIF